LRRLKYGVVIAEKGLCVNRQRVVNGSSVKGSSPGNGQKNSLTSLSRDFRM
jgi:hypothetical protein